MTTSASLPNPPQPAAPAPLAPAPNAPVESALLDQVESKGYGTGNTAVSPEALNMPIPDAYYEGARPQVEEDPFSDDIAKQKKKREQERAGQPGGSPAPGGPKQAGNGGPPKGQDVPFVNPDLQDLSPEQKNEAAANMAKMIMFGYERINSFADSKLQISQKRVLKLYSAGRIDPSCPIPVDAGRSVTFAQFVDIYNEQIRGTLTVEPEFRADVEPVLTRVLAKRGHGFSDEQYLMYTFGTHMVMQGQKFFAQQSTLNAFMKYGSEMTDAWRQNRPAAQAAESTREPVAPPYTPQPQQPQQPTPPQPQQPAPAQQGPGGQQPGDYAPPGGQPMYEPYQNRQTGLAVQQQAMPVFGSKEAMSALKKHSKAQKKRAENLQNGPAVNAEAPGKRKRVPNKGSAKQQKGDA